MANLYIDTEFNGFGGELISMALVDDNDRQFYEVLKVKHSLDPWVSTHVWPKLGKPPVSREEFQKNLFTYLEFYQDICLIADWPEDLRHFCDMLILEPGTMMPLPRFTTIMDRRLATATSTNAHNALADAQAIKKLWHTLND